jgi:hypothetical protein
MLRYMYLNSLSFLPLIFAVTSAQALTIEAAHAESATTRTGLAAVFDAGGEFVTGFKIKPESNQYINYIKNGMLR